MTAEQIKKQESELAAKVMDLSIGKLLLRYHYFSLALCRLAISQLPGKMMTDGKSLCYDAQFILERYKLSDTMPVHDILHSVLHNLFRHWNIGKVEPSLWDCSCDIAVEALICNIAPDLEIEQDAGKRKKIIRELSSRCMLTFQDSSFPSRQHKNIFSFSRSMSTACGTKIMMSVSLNPRSSCRRCP